MQITAYHQAIGRNRALGLALHHGKRVFAGRAIGSADVDFVSLNRLIRANMHRFGACQAFVAGHGGIHIQQPQALGDTCWPFDPVRISHGLPQHLIATADAQDAPAAPMVGGKVDVPALGAQIGQITAR